MAWNTKKGIIFFFLIPKGISGDVIKNPCPVYGLDFNNDGSKFVAVGKDFHVRVYDVNQSSVEIDFPQ